jgi:methionine synthase II (cobalamin-independent)
MSAGKLHRSPPFRAEHLGSLKRPQNLLDARVKLDKREISAAQLVPIENEAITDIVNKQVELGFRAVSDGEYRFVPLAASACACRNGLRAVSDNAVS